VSLGLDNPFLDPLLWSKIQLNKDDVIIGTYAKFGNLRIQIIVQAIIEASKESYSRSLPWVELRHQQSEVRIDTVNKSEGRRVLRTHLPANYSYNTVSNFIFVGRDPRDLVWNLYTFHSRFDERLHSYYSQYGFPSFDENLSFKAYWERWMQDDGFPFWPYFEHLYSWWKLKDQENVLFLHYLDFQKNMERVIQEICKILDISILEKDWSRLMRLCNFDTVSMVSETDVNIESPFWNGGLPKAGEGQRIRESINWEECLNQSDENDLRGRLKEWVGHEGEDWILRGLMHHQ